MMPQKIKDQKKELRQFSAGLAILLTMIAVINFFLHGRIYIYLLPAAVLVLLVGMFLPGWIKPLYWLMTRIGNVLNWIITNLILALMFYLVFTMVGLILRLTGKQLLDVKFRDGRKSYWSTRENPDFRPEGFERQF